MDIAKLNINKVRTDIYKARLLCESRCLYKSCEWIDDLIFCLPEEGEEKYIEKLATSLPTITNNNYDMSVVCFELHEFDRAASFVKQELEPQCQFMFFFSLYKAAEKKRIDMLSDSNFARDLPERVINRFKELRIILQEYMRNNELDGWILYVYGLVLYKFQLDGDALAAFVKAINQEPSNWAAWYMLSLLVDSVEQLNNLELPNHTFKILFHYTMRVELYMKDDDPWILTPMKETKQFIDKYFRQSLFIRTLQAKALGFTNNSQDREQAIQIFKDIRLKDPYRLDELDFYSNLLYVDGRKTELAELAREVAKVDPFTVEANCCIANSYSARGQHSHAIKYFNRALRLNPDHNTSWTLIGHEFLEVKSFEKATYAYRQSVKINKRDCRAWLGLGNVHETIMSDPSVTNPNFDACILYYSQVKKYKPTEPIMWIAMSNVYEKMSQSQLAIHCLHQAAEEGLPKLAKLYEALGKEDEAKKIYQRLT